MVGSSNDIPKDLLAELCRKWKINELSLFGSVLRPDFSEQSDVDVLVVFDHDAPWSYWDWPRLQDELSALFRGRQIDLVERKTIVNPFMRYSILNSRRVLYAA